MIGAAFRAAKRTWSDRMMIYELSKQDFKQKYLGSVMGMVWGFVHPTFIILVYWFVFQIGFKSVPVEKVEFVLWLTAGIIPWFFFAEGFSASTYSIVQNKHLVKQVVFKVELLPLVKIASALYIHLFFIVLAAILFISYGEFGGWYIIQVFYYLFALIILTYGLSLISSSLVLFLKDIGELISILLQLGYWLTPIFWSFTMVPDRLKAYFELNPIYYIVTGYRDSFIGGQWFWEKPGQMIVFWLITAVVLKVGTKIYKKTRPHFADLV